MHAARWTIIVLWIIGLLLSTLRMPTARAATDFPLHVLMRTVPTGLPKSINLRERQIVYGDGGRWSHFVCHDSLTLVDGSFTLLCKNDFANYAATRLRILRYGKTHALYTNIFDGAISPDGRSLALRNAVAGNAEIAWKEQLRIIDITTKSSVRLPLTQCTAHVVRWSGNKLITISDLLHLKDAQGAVAGQVVHICTWDRNGNLIAMVEGQGFTGGTTDRPINNMGFLPRETSVLYAIGTFDGSDPTKSCQIIAMDLTHPSRTATVTFHPSANHDHCTMTGGEIEFDLKTFTLASPIFRYRTHIRDPQHPGIVTVSPWGRVGK